VRPILNDKWKEKILKLLDDPKFELRTDIPVAAAWLVMTLSGKGIPFRVINLGAGAKLITCKTDACPKCRGTGRV